MEKKYARLRYHGDGGGLFGLLLVNALLTILTLGIYSFWGRNKVREFHYSHTEMDGDRFAYHGTGGELFVGMLKATGILFVLFLGLSFGIGFLMGPTDPAEPPSAAIQFGLPIALYAIIGLLMLVAINGARRYRLSRSSWRGIRFSFHGRLGEFMGMMVKGIFLSIITLGFYTPWFQNERRAFFVSNARFGSEPFMYKGEARVLVWPFVKHLLLLVPTLSFNLYWYWAFLHRYYWNHTEMRGARFQSSVDGLELLKLHLVNMLIVVFTLGIGTPWVITRTHEFWCQQLLLVGTVDWASIEQRAQAATGTAEGLAEGLDVDVGIGM
jgi:uncharacterized membrane protein YjgN (DUF898 family)